MCQLPLYLLAIGSQAQQELPTDYLTKEFHAGRRTALRQSMPANSVFVVFAYSTRNFSNDVDYLYHPSPDMCYFSGYREANSMLLVFKDPQTAPDGSTYTALLFVQKRNPRQELWTGKRLGAEGARTKLDIVSYNAEDFKYLPIDFPKFDRVIFDKIPADIARNGEIPGLYELVQQFIQKTGMPADYTTDKRFDNASYYNLTAALRKVKTLEELVLLRKAVEISCQGQNEVMKALQPGMSELEIQGLHEYVHKKYGVEEVGYGSIIGSGENGCTLHYEENTRTHVGQSLVLMDVGAEYHGYSADVTRTVPANGKFSAEEKIIYQLVYDAQEAAFKTLKDGATWTEASKAARDVIENRLLKLGIIKDKKDARSYYPYGLSHHIGLDVHDRGIYNKLKKGMVITIEPGIYIPAGSDCDKKWWSIAVRIEDDALITQNGYELLSRFAPRSAQDIEKIMAQKSALDDFKLPHLQSAVKKGF